MAASRRSRLKLWHLIALVAGSAIVFGVGRNLTREESILVLLSVGGLLALVAGMAMLIGLIVGFGLSFGHAVRLGDRVARVIEGWGNRRGGIASVLATMIGLVLYVSIVMIPFGFAGGLIFALRWFVSLDPVG